MISSARAALDLRRPAQDHAFIAALSPTQSRVARHELKYHSDDSKRAGREEAAARATTSQAKTCLANRPPLPPAPMPLTWRYPRLGPWSRPAAAKGRAGSGGPVVQTRFGLGGGCPRCSPLPSRPLRVVWVARAFVSGHPLQGRAQRGRPASQMGAAFRRIPVASRLSSGGRRRQGEIVAPQRPERRRGRSARQTRAGWSEHHRRGGGRDQNNLRIAHCWQNVPRFLTTFFSISVLYSRPIRPVHSTGFSPRLVHFYAPCHAAIYLFVPALLFTLLARMSVSPQSSESAFAVVLDRPDGRPMRPSRDLLGPRPVQPLRPSGVAGSLARPLAARAMI